MTFGPSKSVASALRTHGPTTHASSGGHGVNRSAILALGAIFVLAVCGGDASAAPAPSATRVAAVATLPPFATAPAATTPAATAPAATTPAATGTPSATSAATPSATGVGLSALAARGKTVYETAGEVGCQDCHGPVGKGGETKAGQGAPDVRGASYQKASDALRGGVPAMSFIKLTTAELEAVVAYLEYLNTLP